MQINDEFKVKIDSFSNLGTGIAKIDGQVIFVENVCPEDFVKIKITKVNKNFANAIPVEIIEPSQNRSEPICPMQKVCGSCQMGFIDYNYQLKLKKQIVQDAIKRIGGLDIEINDVIPSPKIKNYRQKIQYPVSQTKNSKRILAGYYKPQSHDIVNIKYCPIQPSICDEIVEFIREKAPEFGVSGYNEKTHRGDLRHIVIRGSEYSGKFLVTLVVNKNYKNFSSHSERSEESKKFVTSPQPSPKLGEEALVQAIFDKFEEVTGVCLNFNNKKTNVILGEKTECVAGVDFVEEKIIDKVFKIGADTFFQVNPKSAENIFRYVKEKVKKSENPTVLDAYAGIATFGIVVSDVAKSVVSVEFNKNSIEKAKEVLNENNIKNVELFAEDTVKYLKSIKKKFNITILDPPRKGCTQEVLDEVLKHMRTCHSEEESIEILLPSHKTIINRFVRQSAQNDSEAEESNKSEIIYVSCNPATLARDLKYLVSKGCKVESIQPFDMFCHTYHVENVAIISI